MLPVHTRARKRTRPHRVSNIAGQAGSEKGRLRTSLPCFSQCLNQNKQREGALHSWEEADPYCYLRSLGSGNASPEPVSSQEKAAKASATQLTGDKGRAALKKTLILRPRPSLGLTSTLETQDPYLVNSSFCLTGFRLLV